jgi:hypothetical protein
MKSNAALRHFAFATLRDVVIHYDTPFGRNLTEQEKADLVEFIESLCALDFRLY